MPTHRVSKVDVEQRVREIEAAGEHVSSVVDLGGDVLLITEDRVATR